VSTLQRRQFGLIQVPSKVEGVVADFGSAAGAEALIAKLPEVDVLVNNVGIFEPKPLTSIPGADWYRFFKVNVMSGIRLSRHYLSGLLKKNPFGSRVS